MVLSFMSESVCPVFLCEFYSVWSQIIQVFNPFGVDFCVWCQGVFSFHSFPCGCPVFPAPLIEQAVLSPLYILGSFVIDELAVGAWVEFWAFYPVPLIYISVFVPAPCGFDDCCFVVQCEVWQPDSSSSIFLFQDVFGYSGSFMLPNKLENILFKFCEKMSSVI